MRLIFLLLALLSKNVEGFSILTRSSPCTALLRAKKDPNPDFSAYYASMQPIAPVPITASSNHVHLNVERRSVVAGNWKLNPATKKEAMDLLNGLKANYLEDGGSDVVIFPPLPFIPEAISILKGTNIKVGAQNAGSHTKGAFTGEIAPSMLASSGISHVLLGHSERRTLFGEDDDSTNQRVKACLAESSLTVVLCVGETLQEYESNMLKDVLEVQLKKGLAGVSAHDLLQGRVIIAYEPVWAIGTGLVATPAQAQNAHVAVRDILLNMYPYDPDISAKMRIQYGGSVTPDSIKDLMSMPDVDGALVGGASLNAESFCKIIQGSSSTTFADIPSLDTGTNLKTFSHATLSYFSIENLTPKGPRKNADVGTPHDSTRFLAEDGSVSTGSWWCAAGGWPSMSPKAATEVFYVLSGHGCLTDAEDGEKHYFGPGDTVIIPKGHVGRWDVLQDMHKVWFTAEHPDIQGSRKVMVKHYNNMIQSENYIDNQYFSSGTTIFGAGSFGNPSPHRAQVFHILEGVVFLTNADGTAQRCVSGDTVLLPKEWKGQWDVIETMKMVWCAEK
jgi:triosephosphate isomerase